MEIGEIGTIDTPEKTIFFWVEAKRSGLLDRFSVEKLESPLHEVYETTWRFDVEGVAVFHGSWREWIWDALEYLMMRIKENSPDVKLSYSAIPSEKDMDIMTGFHLSVYKAGFDEEDYLASLAA